MSLDIWKDEIYFSDIFKTYLLSSSKDSIYTSAVQYSFPYYQKLSNWHFGFVSNKTHMSGYLILYVLSKKKPWENIYWKLFYDIPAKYPQKKTFRSWSIFVLNGSVQCSHTSSSPPKFCINFVSQPKQSVAEHPPLLWSL